MCFRLIQISYQFVSNITWGTRLEWQDFYATVNKPAEKLFWVNGEFHKKTHEIIKFLCIQIECRVARVEDKKKF